MKFQEDEDSSLSGKKLVEDELDETDVDENVSDEMGLIDVLARPSNSLVPAQVSDGGLSSRDRGKGRRELAAQRARKFPRTGIG
jgi:hypothetical protein